MSSFGRCTRWRQIVGLLTALLLCKLFFSRTHHSCISDSFSDFSSACPFNVYDRIAVPLLCWPMLAEELSSEVLRTHRQDHLVCVELLSFDKYYDIRKLLTLAKVTKLLYCGQRIFIWNTRLFRIVMILELLGIGSNLSYRVVIATFARPHEDQRSCTFVLSWVSDRSLLIMLDFATLMVLESEVRWRLLLLLHSIVFNK